MTPRRRRDAAGRGRSRPSVRPSTPRAHRVWDRSPRAGEDHPDWTMVWLRDFPRTAVSSRRTCRHAVERINEEAGDHLLERLDRPTARRLAARWPNRTIRVARTMSADALRDGVIGANPFDFRAVRQPWGEHDRLGDQADATRPPAAGDLHFGIEVVGPTPRGARTPPQPATRRMVGFPSHGRSKRTSGRREPGEPADRRAAGNVARRLLLVRRRPGPSAETEFAVTTSACDMQTRGVILMVAGVLGLAVSFF
jgi:hypothetical protein